VRKTRSIALTTEGKSLFDEIKHHFDAIDEATTSLISGNLRSTLFVQMPEFFASEIFLPRITEFSESNRNIDLHLNTLAAGEGISPTADLGIVLTGRRLDDKNAKRIFPIHYIPACSPALYEKLAPLDYENFLPDRILLHKARPRAWEMWAQDAGLTKIPTTQIMLLDSMFALIKAAEEGVGVALIPMPLSHSRFEKGTLVPLFKHTLKTEDYYNVIIQPNARNELSSQALGNWIIKTFATL